MPPLPIAYLGLDECGSLPDDTAWFTMAGLLTYRPETIRNLIRRAAAHSGRRLHRHRKAISEFKWNNSSRRFRQEVLNRIARAEVELFTLTVKKGGRRIEDSPENYAVLVCELLQACWGAHPSVSLTIDRRFTSPVQIAVLNTFIYRQWPAPGVLSITHADSQRNTLVQLTDFVAGSVYAWHKEKDDTFKAIEDRVRFAEVREWPEIKQQWLEKRK